MAVNALGWLSGKLGVNITGRDSKKEDKPDVFSSMSDTVFGGGPSNGNRTSADGTQLDEQGLPVGRDWYYYDEQLGRFNVRPDAPPEIRAEHEAKVAAFEAEKIAATREVAPPPPPPPPPSHGGPGSPPPPMMQRLPSAPQYADSGFFSGGN